MDDGTTECRGRLSDDVDLRPIADSKIFVYMSGINKKNATYFFENRSIVLQRAVITTIYISHLARHTGL